MRLIATWSILLLAGAAGAAEPRYAPALAEGDTLRRAGQPELALGRYEAALGQGAPRALALRRIGECHEAVGHWREAEVAYGGAVAADPTDGEAREDLQGLKLRRGLQVQADLGGTEPGTSQQAFEGAVRYGGIEHLELVGGYNWSDQGSYQSNRGYLSAYRFYGRGSYVKGDLTLRHYSYPDDPAVLQPNPDANAYEWVPRGELEVSHVFGPALRAGVAYQLFAANFFHDPSSWTLNQKLSGEVEVRPASFLRLTGLLAALRDPDPDQTEIRGRPTDAPAAATNVVYRYTALLGGAAAVEVGRVGLELKYLPNRDLDNSYRDSILTTLDLRLHERLALRLQQVHDRYSSQSNFSGETADIYMGEAIFTVSRPLKIRAGYKQVLVPTADGRDSRGTLLLGVALRTGLL